MEWYNVVVPTELKTEDACFYRAIAGDDAFYITFRWMETLNIVCIGFLTLAGEAVLAGIPLLVGGRNLIKHSSRLDGWELQARMTDGSRSYTRETLDKVEVLLGIPEENADALGPIR